MKLVKFKVRIPKESDKMHYDEFEFNTPNEVCEALKIKRSTMYAMARGEFRCSQANQKYLEGIIIERTSIPGIAKSRPKIEKSKEEIIEEGKELRKNLVEKLKKKNET